MAILVQKYGGSSVADLARLKRVAQKIIQTRQQGYDLVVVVSAMGDTTDELLSMAKELTESPSRRELDMLLSVGERISMALLSMAIQHQGIEAISLTGSQCGIITTASHSNARIMDVRPFRVQDELAQGRVVIVAGYQGTSYKREVTTLGRGGSDTTAVALAAALGAEACEIYSDVDGIFSADPRVVLDAEKLETLSYEEMLEMSRAGARVLNEQAVAFAQRAKIALYARSTHMPDSMGTVIRPDGFQARADRAESSRAQAVAVSHFDQGLLVHAVPELVEPMLERLDPYTMTMCRPDPHGGLDMFLNLENIHDLDVLQHDLAELGVSCSLDQGMVSVLGTGIGSQAASVVQGTMTLSGYSAQLFHVHDVRCSWLVPGEHVTQAVQALHQRFITSATS